jgi:hypothetical protein
MNPKADNEQSNPLQKLRTTPTTSEAQLIQTSINRMVVGGSDEERLAGLLAAIELCQLDDDYVDLCDRKVIDSLLVDGGSEVSSESSHLLEIVRNFM